MVDVDVEHLPNDIEDAHRLILELLTERNEQKLSYQELYENYVRLSQTHYGRSSEKLTSEDLRQMRLFNEAEAGVQEEIGVLDARQAATVPVAQHARSKPGRKPIDERLPREILTHDVSDEEKHCAACGKERPLVNEEASEEVELIPAKVRVTRHLRRVYGACTCEGFRSSGAPAMLRAPMPARLIAGSIATPGLLAYVLTAKFADSLPFYRQERIFARLGVEISRATLCGWAIAVGKVIQPLIDLMWEKLLEAVLVQMDETTLQVLHEPGRPASRLSYMWVNLAYLEDSETHNLKRLVLFHYHPSRSGDIPLEVLKDYSGYLQTDAYEGYNGIGALPRIRHGGCWSHARRMFIEASRITKKAGSAEVALSFITDIYRIETTLRAQLAKKIISRDQFVEQRAALVRPILARLRSWIEERIERVPPKTALGKALHYTLAQWSRLERYLEAWFLTPDTNDVENAIRPFVVGRKNFLFADTPRGAHASAAIYSLIESGKANGLEPYHYLKYLFTKLPTATTRADYEQLLPISLSPKNLLDLQPPDRPP